MKSDSLIALAFYFALLSAWTYYNYRKHKIHRIQYSAIRKGIDFKRKYQLLKALNAGAGDAT